MKYSVVVNRIDDCTVEIIRNNQSIVLARQSCYVYTINPNIIVSNCPMISYVGVSVETSEKFAHVLREICINELCDSYFSCDVKWHLNNGYPVANNREECDKLKQFAVCTFEAYNKYKEKYDMVRRKVIKLCEVLDEERYKDISTNEEALEILREVKTDIYKVYPGDLKVGALTPAQISTFANTIRQAYSKEYHATLCGLYRFIHSCEGDDNREITNPEWAAIDMIVVAACGKEKEEQSQEG